MKRTTLYKAISLILALLLMFMIFSLSAENAKVSTSTSRSVTSKILSFFYDGFEYLTKSQQTRLISMVDKTVRTLAHFTEYALLSFLFLINISFYKFTKIKKALLSLSGCFIFSVFDEIHQYFVPGRSFQVKDLFFDFLGALAGLLVFHLISIFFSKRKKRRR